MQGQRNIKSLNTTYAENHKTKYIVKQHAGGTYSYHFAINYKLHRTKPIKAGSPSTYRQILQLC